MTLTESPPDAPDAPPRRRWRPGSVEVLAVLLVAVVVLRGPIMRSLATPALQTWLTVFVSVLTQALPFLVFGVVLSSIIAVFVPPSFFAKALPRHPALAVRAAGLAGVVLPGCECASVPVAGALVRRGVTPAAAFAFLLASPAVNPVVLVSTAVAFPGQPRMVVARAVASLVTACLMGWLWQAVGKGSWLRMPSRAHLDGMGKWPAFWASVRHDVLHAGGFLVVGAASAAVLAVVVPKSWLAHVAAEPVVAVLVLGLLAVLLSICSEADAFVAASLTQFSLTARLAFLVVGPMIDLKLFAMQAGIFGRRFALRFAPATFVMAILVSALPGTGAAVNKQAQAVVLLLVGGAVLRAALTGQYLNYVKPGLQPYLIGAGVILVLAGGFTLWYELRGRAEEGGGHDDGHDDGHDHAHSGPKVAWLLLAPVLGLLLFAPPALGSYAAGRSGSAVTAKSEYAPLPAGDPLALPMLDYASRAIFDKGASLGQRRIELTGFAMRGPDNSWLLARMMVSCCAADARPVKVALGGELPEGVADQRWLRVVGQYSRRELQDTVNGEAIPYIEVSEVTLIPVPQEQYES